MRRSDLDSPDESAEPRLFDLPLEPERERAPQPRAEAPRPRPAERPRPVLPELPLGDAPERPVRPAPAPRPYARHDAEEPAAAPKPRGAIRGRLGAGLADVVVHAALAVVAVAGARLLGVPPRLSDWPALAAFLLVFSFLYTVLPLAFWGQSLGMSWAGLTSHNRDGEPLTFDQAARRWLGALLTAATLGLPILIAGRGRTLSDLLSGSATYPAD